VGGLCLVVVWNGVFGAVLRFSLGLFSVFERVLLAIWNGKKEEFAGDVAQHILGYLGKKC